MKKQSISIYEGEVEISLDIQKEYIEYHNHVDIEKYDCNNVIVQSRENLFSTQTPVEIKKKLLFLLGNFATNECFKILGDYIDNPKTDLKDWATLAMQDLRLKVENEVYADGRDMVMSPVGGKGDKLRFYAVVSTKLSKPFTKGEEKIIKKQLTKVVEDKNSKVESIEYGNEYALIKILISINVAPAEIFDTFLDICSKKRTDIAVSLFYREYAQNNQKRDKGVFKRSKKY